jgi:hypothetical protein
LLCLIAEKRYLGHLRVKVLRSKPVGIAVAAVLFVLLLGISPQAMAFTSGQTAVTAIGQPNLTSGSDNNGNGFNAVANGILEARDIAFDSHGDLWVADTDNNRILEFVPGTGSCPPGQLCTNMAASIVLGQMGMTARG